MSEGCKETPSELADSEEVWGGAPRINAPSSGDVCATRLEAQSRLRLEVEGGA